MRHRSIQFVFTAATLVAGLIVHAAPADQDGKLGGKIDALIKQLQDKSPKKRSEAARSLGEMGKDAEPATNAICGACCDKNSAVVVAALDALSKVNPELYKPVSSAVLERSLPVAQFNRLGTRANPAAPVVLTYLDACLRSPAAPRDATFGAIDCLRAIAPSDETTIRAMLAICVARPGSDFAMSVYPDLIEASKNRKELRKKLYEAMVAGVVKERSYRQIRWLGKLGPDAKDALPLLDSLRFDRNGEIRSAAEEAISQIKKPAAKE